MKVQFPVDLFDKLYTAKEICSCLQRFVMEARKEDGSCYPPKTSRIFAVTDTMSFVCLGVHKDSGCSLAAESDAKDIAMICLLC